MNQAHDGTAIRRADPSGSIGPDRPADAIGPAGSAGAAEPRASAGVTGHGKTGGLTFRRVCRTVAFYIVVFPGAFAYLRLMEPGCSSSDIGNSVASIVETKLMHVKRFSVSLTNIEVLDRGLLGDQKCSADLIIDGAQTLRRVEYHWDTRRGSLERTYATMTF